MELHAIEMEAGAAREALRQYRADLKAAHERSRTEADRELAAIDAAVMKGLRELGRGRRVIELSKVIAAGGVTKLEDLPGRTWGGETVRVDVLAPALCVTRADARTCWTPPLMPPASPTVSLTFQADGWLWRPRKADLVEMPLDQVFDVGVELANAGFEYDADQRRAVNNMHLKAMAPTIPPVFRPPHALRGYHLLWEPEWSVGSTIPPGDPALLKHLGGDLFAVLAVWDLTPLERAALAQVRAG